MDRRRLPKVAGATAVTGAVCEATYNNYLIRKLRG